MTSSQYANHVCFRRNQSLRVKQKNKEESGTHIGVNAVNASLWFYGYLYGKRCQDTIEVSEELSEGQRYLTKPSRFKIVCMEKPVLHASLSALNYLRGDSMENLDNSSYRFAGYNQYTFWVHNYLGIGVRKVIPSCAV